MHMTKEKNTFVATSTVVSFVNRENVVDLTQYLANLNTVFTCHKIFDSRKDIGFPVVICTLLYILFIQLGRGEKWVDCCIEGVICLAKSRCSIKAQSKTFANDGHQLLSPTDYRFDTQINQNVNNVDYVCTIRRKTFQTEEKQEQDRTRKKRNSSALLLLLCVYENDEVALYCPSYISKVVQSCVYDEDCRSCWGGDGGGLALHGQK